MSEYEAIGYQVSERVATITLNRPEAMNAFDAAMRRETLAAVHAANADDDVRVVVLRGAGRGFSAGADLGEDFTQLHPTVEDLLVKGYQPIMLAIHDAPKLYIASVHGAAAGIASALVLVCDLVIMAEDAYLYQAFAAIALVPDGGACWHLVSALGYQRALQMVVEGEKVPAERCVALGLANRTVPGDALVAETQAWAERLVAGAPLAQRYSKQILRRAMRTSLTETIALEAKLQNMMLDSKDVLEGTQAFFEKRPAVFTGE